MYLGTATILSVLISSVGADSAVLAAQLKLVGSCRGSEDRARLDQLQGYCRELGLQDCVQFCTSVPFEELRSLLAGAVGGLHTMLDEHFGISIVEYMAAGKASDSPLSLHCTFSNICYTSEDPATLGFSYSSCMQTE